MSMLALSFHACSDNEQFDAPSAPAMEENHIHSADTGVKFTSEAVVLGVSGNQSGEITTALDQLLTNVSSTITDKTQLLIVPNLSDRYKKDINTVYNNGGIVAVTNPNDAELDNWFKANNWDNKMLSNGAKGAIMFSFAKDYHYCITTSPDNAGLLIDQQDEEAMPDQINKDGDATEEFADYQDHSRNEMYTYLSSWVQIMNRDIQERNKLNQRDNNVLAAFHSQMTRAKEDETKTDISKIFNRISYSTCANFSGRLVVRKLPGSNPDYIDGSGSVGITLDIYQIHCYKGENPNNAGDYYLINMHGFLASSNMYIGKKRNRHGGCYVRYCGMYAKSLKTEFIPWNENTNKPYSTTDVILRGKPTPESTNGHTSYTTSSSFSLNTELSVSGSIGKEDGKAKMGIGAEAKIGAGWTWSESETRSISDMDIVNAYSTTNPYDTIPTSKVGYNLVFNNLPRFRWSQQYGIDEGNAQMFRSTAWFSGSWVWQKLNVADDSEERPIGIKVRTSATYGALSFVTTSADLKEFTTDQFGYLDKTIHLKPFCRMRCGAIVFNNNFKDENGAIKSVEVYEIGKDENNNYKETKVWGDNGTLMPGKSITTGALPITKKYMIYFTTTSGKKYKYTTYPQKNVKQEIGNDVFASIDFSPVTK